MDQIDEMVKWAQNIGWVKEAGEANGKQLYELTSAGKGIYRFLGAFYDES